MWNTGMLSLNRKWPFIRSHVFFVPRSGRYTDTCLNSTHMESTQSLFRISRDQHVPLWPPSVTVAQHLVVCATWVTASRWNVSLFLRIRLARWRLSGVDRILYLGLARITSITSYSNPSSLLHHPYHSTHSDMPFPSQRPGSFRCLRLSTDSSGLVSVSTRHSTCSQRTLTMHARGQLTGSRSQTALKASLKLDMKPSGWIQYTLLWLRPFLHRFSHQITCLWGINVKFNLVMWRSGDTVPANKRAKHQDKEPLHQVSSPNIKQATATDI